MPVLSLMNSREEFLNQWRDAIDLPSLFKTQIQQELLMRNRRITAKNKINAAHLHGVLLVAALFGAITGSWMIFLITTGVLLVTSFHDGSMRL